MKLRNLGIIISREYLNKVKKKSFLILTFVVPILFAALCVVPSLIMLNAKEDAKTIAVLDESGIVLPSLENTETISYQDCSSSDLESLKNGLEEGGYDAVLSISALSEDKSVEADVYSKKPLGIDTSENIDHNINKAVEDYRISTSGVENLKELMKDVKSDVRLRSHTVSDTGEETDYEAGVFSIITMLLGMLIYMFIALFCGMVMSSVIEEKSSRVVEVLISSVKATELMFGKIIGVALVALTQFLLWIVLTLGILGVVGVAAGQDFLKSMSSEDVAEMAGVSPEQLEAVTGGMDLPGEVHPEVAADSELSVIMSTVQNMPIGKILLCFFIFFVFGYILYAAMFAAIGSACENEADSQQLQLPITIPLIIGFFISIIAMRAPQSPVVWWGSMIPFTSPIVMLSRIPNGVPGWELILSIVLLVATTAFFAWLSAKIYKVGILMFGKKSTWKDLWKWLKQN